MSDLLLPSEIRRLQALKDAEGKKTPEKAEVPAEATKPALNPVYPFVPQEQIQGKTDYELEDLNRVCKIMMFHDQPEKYQEIIRLFPEQKFFRDKFNYEQDDTEKTNNKGKRGKRLPKAKAGTFYN